MPVLPSRPIMVFAIYLASQHQYGGHGVIAEDVPVFTLRRIAS